MCCAQTPPTLDSQGNVLAQMVVYDLRIANSTNNRRRDADVADNSKHRSPFAQPIAEEIRAGHDG